MQNFKYFSYGYSPNPKHSVIYGLYQPVLNCFLIVFPDFESIGMQLTALLSSRYLLQPVRIDTADNYYHNIIDNTVCENWTISNFDTISVSDIAAKMHLVLADQLIASTPVDCMPIQIQKEKEWAQFCLFWLRFIQTEISTGASGLWIDNQIGNLDLSGTFEPLIDNHTQLFVKQTMQLLYLGLDPDLTEQHILDLLDQSTWLKYRYEQFLKGYNEPTDTANTCSRIDS